MTSAAFSMPGDPGKRISIRRRSTRTSTATSTAAEEALGYMLDRRLRKREGRAPPPRRQAAGGGGAVAASVGQAGSPLWLVRAGVLVCVGLVLGVAVLKLSPAAATSHTVAGRVLVGKQPLRHATIVFHRAIDGGDEAVSLTTAADGSFRIEEDRPLPAGLYAVVVASAASAAEVPAMYRAADTTPLRVLVTEDLSGLQLLVRR